MAVTDKNLRIILKAKNGAGSLVYSRNHHIDGITIHEQGYHENPPKPEKDDQIVHTSFPMEGLGWQHAIRFAYDQLEERPEIVKVEISKIKQ